MEIRTPWPSDHQDCRNGHAPHDAQTNHAIFDFASIYISSRDCNATSSHVPRLPRCCAQDLRGYTYHHERGKRKFALLPGIWTPFILNQKTHSKTSSNIILDSTAVMRHFGRNFVKCRFATHVTGDSGGNLLL